MSGVYCYQCWQVCTRKYSAVLVNGLNFDLEDIPELFVFASLGILYVRLCNPYEPLSPASTSWYKRELVVTYIIVITPQTFPSMSPGCLLIYPSVCYNLMKIWETTFLSFDTNLHLDLWSNCNYKQTEDMSQRQSCVQLTECSVSQ